MATLLPPCSYPRKEGYGTLNGVSSQGDVEIRAASLQKTNPSKASFFSKLLFSYANPLMAEGNHRQLNNDDLWELEGKNRTANAFDTYRLQFERCGRSIFRAMFFTYGGSFAVYCLALLFWMACGVFAPAVLHHVIDAFAAPEVDFSDLAIWLLAFFVSKIVNAFLMAQMNYFVDIVALRLAVSMKSLLFEKTMRRSIQSKSDPNAVDIANLFSSDISNVFYAAFQINNVWVLPLQIVIVIYMLYAVIDLAAFAGLGVIALSTVASFFIAKYEGTTFADIMERKDTRMKVIREVFASIQIVKLNAWESKFADKIGKIRAHELSAITRFVYLGASSIIVLWASPLFVSMISFAVYSIGMGQQLTAAKVFTAIALFNVLRQPLRELPRVISQCIQAKVSIDRMQAFLSLGEYEPTNVIRDGSGYPEDVAIDIKDGSFGWTKDTALLKNVNLTIKKGDFVVVHGAVGAGKSSLCSALLGEMDKLSGSVFVRGRVAYYSQQTWIQNMTIRENVLFGKAYDEKLYERVLDACGLLPDLEGFPAGDSTEIGQKGVNLSGGQKARLCLARACYADADVLILDSPLAAVDAVVQSEIFSKCLCSLLESKTVVLVTHAPDIIGSDAANYKLEVVDGVVSGDRRDVSKRRAAYVTRLSPRMVKEAAEDKEKATEDADAGRLVDDEEREEGRVSKDVFLKYFNAVGGVHICVFLLIVQTLWQGFQIASDFWLSHWTGEKLGAYDEERTEHNMKIYVLLGLGSASMVLVRAVTISFVGLRACTYLFNAMTRSLLHAPLRFFDANPIGRIINRYGDDMSSVDFLLPFSFGDFLATLFFTMCQLATAIYTVNFLGIFVLPLVYIYVKITNYCLAPTREISRLWKVSASPVLSHVTGSEEGVTVIRAFGQSYVERSIIENFKRNDDNNKVWFAQTVTSQWFQVRMQLVGCGLLIVIVSALVYLHTTLTPGIIGLAFSYALNVDARLSKAMRSWSWVEICMVSPERILEYVSIPREGDCQLLQIEPSPQWPQHGTIEFDNVVFTYKEGAPPVLKDLSFSIKNNEKIGIVGRTGAGKSSLTMALFRINELVSGRVMIDGVDISTMPLKSLRSHLSIIPQSPVLFKGTLRAYMDPFDEYSDEEIWSAFQKVEMKDQITALEGQLLYELSENGENFSVGERQMLCMARAMLTKARIVVMDEATASIDHVMEKKLQDMINRDFEEATVLTIAHRLATVLNSDRIMVLSDGRVVEFDTPSNLVKDEGGMFYELAKEGGVLENVI